MRKPTIKSLRKKADDLLSPLVIKLYPSCLLCGRPTEVAHHHCHKSKSNSCRYYLPNLINLCCSCHFALHKNESLYASRIVAIKGLEWFKDIEKKKQEYVKTDIYFYLGNYERLSKLLS